MNSQLIRARLNQDASPFVFPFSEGTRVPGQIFVIDPKTEGVTCIHPLHIVAIGAKGRAKTNGKH